MATKLLVRHMYTDGTLELTLCNRRHRRGLRWVPKDRTRMCIPCDRKMGKGVVGCTRFQMIYTFPARTDEE